MKVAHLSEPAEERVLFRDGLGVREWREVGPGERVEWLHLAPAFAAVEAPLRERVTRLTKLQHVKLSRILSLEPARKGSGPILVSSLVEGTRLADVLEMAGHGLVAFDAGAGLQVTREVLAALAVLHDSRNVTHGALGPERIVLTGNGRVVMVEHVLAQALDRLQLPRHQLWRDWRIPTPPAAGPVRFDIRTDVAQAGLLVLAALLGRPLEDEEYPHRLRGLLPIVQDRLAKSPASAIASAVVTWLERLVPVDAPRSFATVREAQQAFDALVSRGATAMGVAPARVKGLVAAVAAIGSTDAASPTVPASPASPLVAVDARLAPLAVDARLAPLAEVRDEPAPPDTSDIDIDALLALEAELEGDGVSMPAAPGPVTAAPSADVVAATPSSMPEPELEREFEPDLDLDLELGIAPEPALSLDVPALDVLAQERLDLERQFAELVAAVAPAAPDGPIRLLPETPDSSQPLVDAWVRWSSMPVDATDEVVSDAGTVAAAEPVPDVAGTEPPVEHAGDAGATEVADPEGSFRFEPLVLRGSDPAPVVPIEAALPSWWKDALPWRAADDAPDAGDAAREPLVFEAVGLDEADAAAPLPVAADSPRGSAAEIPPPIVDGEPPVATGDAAPRADDALSEPWAAADLDTLDTLDTLDRADAMAVVEADVDTMDPATACVALDRVDESGAALSDEQPPLTFAVDDAWGGLAAWSAVEGRYVEDAATAADDAASADGRVVAAPNAAVAAASADDTWAPPSHAGATASLDLADLVVSSDTADDTCLVGSAPAIASAVDVATVPEALEAEDVHADAVSLAAAVSLLPRASDDDAPTDWRDALAGTPASEPQPAPWPVLDVPSSVFVREPNADLAAADPSDAPDTNPIPVDAPAVEAPTGPLITEILPEVVIVDDGSDGDAWDHLPSEAPTMGPLEPSAASIASSKTHQSTAAPPPAVTNHDAADLPHNRSVAPPAAVSSKKKRRRSRRRKAAGSPTSMAPSAAMPATRTPVMMRVASPPAIAPMPDVPARDGSKTNAVPGQAATDITADSGNAPANGPARSLLDREVPSWTPPADLGTLRPRVVPTPVHDGRAEDAQTPAVAANAQQPVKTESPVRAVAQATPPPVESVLQLESEIHAVGMPDLDDLSPKRGAGALTAMAEAMAPTSSSSRHAPLDSWTADAPVPAARAMNWRRLIAASVLIALFQGAAFAAWWWAQPGASGTLVVQTARDGVEVLIDGQVVGKTPLREDLAPGRHTLTLRRGKQLREMPVEISLGVVTTQALDWPAADDAAKGAVQVTSTPAGAEVFLNGSSRGKAPLLLEALSSGKHELTLRGDAGSVTVIATVVAGETTPLEVPIFAGWMLVDAPVELSLMLSREKIGSSMDGQILMPPGTHRVQAVSEPLGIRQSFTVTIEPGEVKRVTVRIPTSPLQVQDEPGSEVFVDGERVGTLPGTLQIAVGTHDVLVRRPDGSERRQTVTARQGETLHF